MPLTPADQSLLAMLAKYYVLTREQLQRLSNSGHSSGRTTRKRLAKLLAEGFIARHNIPVALPNWSGAAPVYFPTKSGAEALASSFNDERFLAINTRHPRGDRLAHWIAVNETRMVIEQAIAKQNEVSLDGWINEWEPINKADAEPQHFTLHTQLCESPKLSCSPDAGFVLSLRGFSKVYYLERDLGTSSPHQVAARKTRGYAELSRQQGHFKHFANSNVPTFSVLFVSTTPYRCTQLGKELRHREMPELWLMVDEHELTPESFLHSPIIHRTDGSQSSLVKPVAREPGVVT